MEKIIRKYSMTDATLIMFASNLNNTLLRDISSLNEFGITSIDISNLEAKNNTFKDFPPDIFYHAEIGMVAETKENTRLQILDSTRKIVNRSIIKWGVQSPQYKKFGTKEIALMSDKKLHSTALMVATTAEEYLLDLADEGLTQLIIDSYSSLTDQFEDNLKSLADAIELRELKTRERITLGNELYSYVSKYCKIGKLIWKNNNYAKYNDYLLYKYAKKKAKKEEK